MVDNGDRRYLDGEMFDMELPSEQWMMVADWLRPMESRHAHSLMVDIVRRSEAGETSHVLPVPVRCRSGLDIWLARQCLRLAPTTRAGVFVIAEVDEPAHERRSILRCMVADGSGEVGAVPWATPPPQPPPPPRRQVRLDVGPFVTRLRAEGGEVEPPLRDGQHRLAALGAGPQPRPGLLVRGWRYLVQVFGRWR